MKTFLTCRIAWLTVFLLAAFPLLAQTTSNATSNADAHVYSGSTGTNYGTATAIPIWVQSSTNYYRYYVNFDIAALSIPTNAIVYSAELRLKPNATGETGVTSSSFVLQQVSSSWTEGGVKFNAQPSTTTANQVTTNSLVSGKRVFNVTAIVQGIVSGTSTNYGFMIRRNPENTITGVCEYNSREVATSSDRPQLVVQWYIPMSVSAATITHASDNTTADGSISPTITNGSGSFTYQWYDLNSSTESAISGQTSLSISSRSAGCYGLRVTGTWGDVYYMAFLLGVDCNPVTINFYPGSNYLDDVNLFQNSSSPGNGSNTLIESGYNGSKETIGLTRFRLWMDPSYTALQANLLLKGHSHVVSTSPTNDAAFYLHTQDWSENNTTYANRPSINALQVINVPATTTTTQNQTIDIASFWNIWKTSNTTNYGMRLQLDAYGSGISSWQRYHSGDATTATNRPYIQFQIDQVSCDRTSYASFKRELDAGYVSTFQGNLKIQFTEEYEQVTGKKVPLKLYDQNHDLKAAIDYDGSAIAGKPLLPALNYQFDDNRHVLNLSTYSLVNGQFYLLELTKSTGEKEYIRFMYTN